MANSNPTTKYILLPSSKPQHAAARRQRARRRLIKRVVHFLGFLAVWGTALALAYAVTLCTLVLLVIASR